LGWGYYERPLAWAATGICRNSDYHSNEAVADNYTNQSPLRPIVELDLNTIIINFAGSGSSGNPYTLVKK